MLYYQLWRDHARPDLIWNHKTREELREALESELRGFNIDKVESECLCVSELERDRSWYEGRWVERRGEETVNIHTRHSRERDASVWAFRSKA
jgi:hypothetical protein